MNKRITELRLQKEEESLQKDPLSQAIVTRASYLKFHFCLFGLEEEFAKGFYHGVIQLPEDYPFAPPKLLFYTQNGRFEVGKPICTTFTHYHKQTWSSSWNIRTIITALISFMYSNEKGIAGIFDCASRRKALAKRSLTENLSNAEFVSLFKEKMISRGIIPAQKMQEFLLKINQKMIKKQKQRENLTSSEQKEQEDNEKKEATEANEFNQYNELMVKKSAILPQGDLQGEQLDILSKKQKLDDEQFFEPLQRSKTTQGAVEQ